MKVSQVFEFLNQAIADTGNRVTVTDTTSLVDFGKTLLSDDNNALRDNFFKKLIDRIGRTVIEERKYVGNKLGLRKEPFEFGAILQKIYVEPMQAKKNNSWDLTDGQVVNPGVVYKANVEVRVFSKIDTWEVPITIVREQIKSAFANEQALSAFISAIFAKVEDSLAVMYEKIEEYVFCTMIANSLNYTVPDGDYAGRNLLKIDLYNIIHEEIMIKGVSSEDYYEGEGWLYDEKVLTAILNVINNYSLLMERMTNIFNSKRLDRFTPLDRQRLVIHSKLATALDTVLRSNSFNKELVKFRDENVKVVPYWQSFNGYNDDLDAGIVYPTESMAIKIQNDQIASGASIENDCVLAVLYDEEAIATTIENRRTTVDYIGASEMTNYYNKADIGYIIDPSENCIVFVWNP